jgi:hypothetical protein
MERSASDSGIHGLVQHYSCPRFRNTRRAISAHAANPARARLLGSGATPP